MHEPTPGAEVEGSDSPSQAPPNGDINSSTLSPVSIMSTLGPSTQHPVSKPINPNAPSFLALPGEIRNAVYTELFIRDTPIEVVHCEDTLSHSVTSLNLGVSLLSSCRQVHQEASSILYSHNDFLVSSGNLECYTNALFEWASDWLTNIGRQANYVRRLLINVHQTDIWTHELDVLPILVHLWQHVDTSLKVELVDIETPIITGIWSYGAEDDRLHIHIDEVNNVLRSLSATSVVNIKTYAKFPRMLRRVLIHKNGMSGSVQFHSPMSDEDYTFPRIHFGVSDGGELYKAQDRSAQSGIGHIMRSHLLADSIMEMVLPISEEITFDLTNRSVTPLLPPVLGVNKLFRSRARRFFTSNTFNARMTTSERKCSFSKELAVLRNCPWISETQDSSHDWRPLHVILRYEVTESLGLDDTRFDAIAFIKAISQHKRDMTVRIELACFPDQKLGEIRFTLTLEDIRSAVIVCLSDLALQYPERLRSLCPTIWMNGRGKAHEAEFDAGTSRAEMVVNDNINLDQSIMRGLAHAETIRYLKHHRHERKEYGKGSLGGTLEWFVLWREWDRSRW